MNFPKELVKNILSIYGQVDKEWLDNLPNLLFHYAKNSSYLLKIVSALLALMLF